MTLYTPYSLLRQQLKEIMMPLSQVSIDKLTKEQQKLRDQFTSALGIGNLAEPTRQAFEMTSRGRPARTWPCSSALAMFNPFGVPTEGMIDAAGAQPAGGRRAAQGRATWGGWNAGRLKNSGSTICGKRGVAVQLRPFRPVRPGVQDHFKSAIAARGDDEADRDSRYRPVRFRSGEQFGFAACLIPFIS